MEPAQVDQLFHAIDAMDPDAFVAFLTPTGTFKFGNAPPVHGRAEVRALVHGFWQSIHGSAHRRLHVWRDGDAVAVHGEVTYTRQDARQVTVPFVNVFKMDGAHIAEYLIHIDNTPLFAP